MTHATAPVLLATDLDGTFLGGSEHERRALYDHLAAREDVMLVFVTGRDIDFIAGLIETPGMPRPRYIVGDIGTSVFDGEVCGFDCLLSADRFFDVLPRGVSKGPTLMRLVEALGLDREAVLVAGDTMNDLSLFQTGFKGVAVGNSEPRLKAAVSRLPNVYCSPSPGAAGIADAIRHFNFKGGQRHEKIIAGHRLSPAAQ